MAKRAISVQEDSELYRKLKSVFGVHIKALEELEENYETCVQYELNAAVNVVRSIAIEAGKSEDEADEYVEECVKELLHNVRVTYKKNDIGKDC